MSSVVLVNELTGADCNELVAGESCAMVPNILGCGRDEKNKHDTFNIVLLRALVTLKEQNC